MVGKANGRRIPGMGTRRPADDLSSDVVDGFRHASAYVAKFLLAPGAQKSLNTAH